jgi:uncharacterized SAM-binding protein YcdF (DUF218 family)
MSHPQDDLTERPGRAARLRHRLGDLAAGAAAGLILWTCAILLGVPNLLGFRDGYDFALVAALVGALAALSPLRRALYVKAAVFVVIIAVIAYTPLVDAPVKRLVRRDLPPPGSPAPGAVIVLGADITADSLLTGQSLDRVLAGAALVKSGVAPRFVLSGNVARYGRRHVSSATDQQRIVTLAGIDPAQVQVVDSVFSTRDEAMRAWAQLAPQGVRRVVVVTSPAHSGRACRAFERVGFAVVCTPSVSRDVPFTVGTLRGSADRLAAFRLWLYERIAFQYYHLKGWI